MVQKVAVSREFEARVRHAATGKLSLSTQQKMGTFFELGKDKAAKGEGWAPPVKRSRTIIPPTFFTELCPVENPETKTSSPSITPKPFKIFS